MDEDERAFDTAMTMLKAEFDTAWAHLEWEGQVRNLYRARIDAMSREMRLRVARGELTWAQAAREASSLRNEILTELRRISTAPGRAMAQSLKSEGRPFNALVAEKTQKLFGRNADFNRLVQADKERVFKEIVESAGRDRGKLSARLMKFRGAARGLLVFSIAMSVYAVAEAEDKAAAAKKEAATFGAGIAGGAAGGAVAGLVCGPGAPVCVTAGAFIGGALAAFGVSLVW